MKSASKERRRCKLHAFYQSSTAQSRNVPWLNIRGQWLERAGFQVGDAIEITVKEGQLIITKSVADGNR